MAAQVPTPMVITAKVPKKRFTPCTLIQARITDQGGNHGATDLRVDREPGWDFTALMRSFPTILLLGALVLSGCGKKKDQSSTDSTGAKAGASGKRVVTPESRMAGRVATVNPVGHFVILNFPTGRMPAQDQHLNLYRRDVKVGEVKVVGPQRGANVVADVVSGDPEVSDEAREN